MALNPLVDSRDVRFVLFEMLEVDKMGQQFPQYADYDRDTYEEFLNLAERIAVEQIYPANSEGDSEGCTYDPQTAEVRIPECYKKPLDAYYEAGFLGMTEDPEFGGLGMPNPLGMGCSEYLSAASVPFLMYPMLTHGAMLLIKNFGTDEIKDLYIDKMMSGEWGGTMCLTEADAGSDVGLGKSKAVKQEDGTYRIYGQNIFISSGDNDYYKNMIHLKLARIEGDPQGTKGLSIFVVPKYRANPDGSVGEFNDVVCAGIEHKMGIKASSTCTLSFGDNGDCTGYLLGEERKGMKIMFQMMNEARLGVSVQGLSLGSTAYMHAVTYAKNRIQGTDVTRMLDPEAGAVNIIRHPDVKRMLLSMKSYVEGMRFLSYFVCKHVNIEEIADGKAHLESKALSDLLLSVAKAGNTDTGFAVTSEAVQVYGGYGYCSDYPVEQLMRDARIFPIYEGTNGIQSANLAIRQILMNKEQKNYSVFKKKVEETMAGSRGIVDDRYIAIIDRGLKKFNEVIEMMKRQMNEGKFLYLFSEATPLQQAMFMLCLAWGHLWSLQIALPRMKELLGSAKGEEREKLLQENSEAAYYYGRVLSARFFIGSEFLKFFGTIEYLLNEESAVISASETVFTGALEE
ncbi:MAG: acyl-CoA dehydrogenase [bacterium]|nr:acyl-CoA dehydrogenase [bacterium]